MQHHYSSRPPFYRAHSNGPNDSDGSDGSDGSEGAAWLPGSVTLSHSCEDVSDGGPDRTGLVSTSSVDSSCCFSEVGLLTSALTNSMKIWCGARVSATAKADST